MKLSSILNIFMLLTVCSTNVFCNNEKFEEFFKKQPSNARGYKSDLKKLWDTGECSNCKLVDYYLGEAIKKHAGNKIDLSRSDCTGANLSNVNLSGANLSDGRFDFASFENSTLDNANAVQASFKHANMSFVKMQYATIQNAKFRHACLFAANFYGAKVNTRTAFRYANCREADFRNLDGGFHPNGAPGKANFKEADLKNCKIDPSSLDSSLLLKIAYRINRFYDSHPKPVL